jgi:hypothetical protein
MKLLNKLNWKRSSLKAQKVYELKSYKFQYYYILDKGTPSIASQSSSKVATHSNPF